MQANVEGVKITTLEQEVLNRIVTTAETIPALNNKRSAWVTDVTGGTENPLRFAGCLSTLRRKGLIIVEEKANPNYQTPSGNKKEKLCKLVTLTEVVKLV